MIQSDNGNGDTTLVAFITDNKRLLKHFNAAGSSKAAGCTTSLQVVLQAFLQCCRGYCSTACGTPALHALLQHWWQCGRTAALLTIMQPCR